MARKTWGADSRWDLGGGGTVWDSMTYDPELDLLYIGTGNGSPHPIWNRDPGHPKNANLFLSSIVAVDATNGRMKWYYKTTPGDSWDYTATQNRSEEHTSELQSLMRISYAVFCLKKKTKKSERQDTTTKHKY